MTGERYTGEHEGVHCSRLILPVFYAITRATPDGPQFIRWSTLDDPPFPCVCDCEPCTDWRKTMEEIDGPVVLPSE